MQHKVGLVLSGGGGKGAYEIGVIKALVQSGIDKKITAISGTSVGTLNMALFLQNNVPLAENIWLSLTPSKVFSIHSDDIFQKIYELPFLFGLLPGIHSWMYKLALEGMFTLDGLTEIIEQNINLDLIKNSPIASFATCCELSSLQKEYFKLNNLPKYKIMDILLASSAIPIVFSPQIIDGKKYVDGGLPYPYGDNTPVQKVYEEGCTLIIVVHLDPGNKIDTNLFPGPRIIDIFPTKDLGGIKGTFDFNQETIMNRIILGYKNAKNVIKTENIA